MLQMSPCTVTCDECFENTDHMMCVQSSGVAQRVSSTISIAETPSGFCRRGNTSDGKEIYTHQTCQKDGTMLESSKCTDSCDECFGRTVSVSPQDTSSCNGCGSVGATLSFCPSIIYTTTRVSVICQQGRYLRMQQRARKMQALLTFSFIAPFSGDSYFGDVASASAAVSEASDSAVPFFTKPGASA